MVEVRSPMREQQQQSAESKRSNVREAEAQPQAPPPPPPQRRPRVREVSSRFMSPMVTCSSSGDLHLVPTRSPIPKRAMSTPTTTATTSTSTTELQSRQRSNSVQRRWHQELLEPLCSSSADENNRPDIIVRSLDAPLGLQQYKAAAALPLQRKQRAVKLFNKENNGSKGDPDSRSKSYDSGKLLSGKPVNNVNLSRLDTPIPNLDRITSSSSRFRSATQGFKRSTEICASSAAATPPPSTAAVKLLQSSGIMSSSSPQTSNVGNKVVNNINNKRVFTEENITRKHVTTSCDSGGNSPIQNSCKTRSVSDCRYSSSVPEADGLPPTMFSNNNKLTSDRNCGRGGNANVITVGDASKVSASPCSRSLNFSLLSYEQSPSYPLRTSEKPAAALLKTSSNSTKMGGFCLPPLPSFPKLDADGRKGRKVSSTQEEVHFLRLLQNHYLQWRFANAKAEACVHSQLIETEVCISLILIN